MRRYQFERELGRGGMAVVWLARDLKHERLVALKVFHSDFAADVGVARFLREIRLTARLQHPHILPVFDSGEAAGFLWYTMPYVEGETLRARLTRDRQLPIQESIRLVAEVADALDYACSAGVIHRDIKPENIYLSRGHALVADFGVARVIDAYTRDEMLTSEAIAIGTVWYMSPEQAAGELNLDGRTDIYSLGCVLYEMIAGERPIGAASLQATIAKLFTEQVAGVRSRRSEAPRTLEQVVAKAMAKSRDERYASARAFSQALHEVEVANRESRPAGKTKQFSRWGFAALGVVLLASIGGWFATRRTNTVPLSVNRLAVMPFSATGSTQVEGIGSGMVELLGGALDGAGDLTTVDEHAVVATLRREAADSSDPVSASCVARLVGAGRFVIGNIAFLGGRALVNAALYTVNRAEPVIQIHEIGSPDSLTDLVNRVARKLVAGSSPAAEADLTELAGITTHSNDALKAYLRGRLRFRDGRHELAVADFERAVAIDSNFVLGWYALGRTASFTAERDLERRALIRAHTLRTQLQELDQLRIEAELLYPSGHAQKSERVFREILRRRPDDLDAQFGLATLLVHSAHLMGRSALEAAPLLDRVRYYEPNSLDVLNFGRGIAAESRNLSAYDSLSRRYVQLSPNADFVLPYIAEQAFLRRDTTAERDALTKLSAADDFVVGFAATSVGGWVQDLAGAASITGEFLNPRRTRDIQSAGRIMLALDGAGRKAEAKEWFKRAAGWNFNGANTALSKSDARKRAD